MLISKMLYAVWCMWYVSMWWLHGYTTLFTFLTFATFARWCAGSCGGLDVDGGTWLNRSYRSWWIGKSLCLYCSSTILVYCLPYLSVRLWRCLICKSTVNYTHTAWTKSSCSCMITMWILIPALIVNLSSDPICTSTMCICGCLSLMSQWPTFMRSSFTKFTDQRFGQRLYCLGTTVRSEKLVKKLLCNDCKSLFAKNVPSRAHILWALGISLQSFERVEFYK